MARSKSSHRWLRSHFDDEFVKRAQREGYRSRAVYKLYEIQQKDRILKQGMNIVDLGAAPGGWSQYAAGILQGRGRIIAMDILPMEPLDGVEFLQGDFREDEVLEALMEKIDDRAVDLVMSDMAPNISGIRTADQARSMELVELAEAAADRWLKPGGAMVVKIFQGEGVEDWIRRIRGKFGAFKQVKHVTLRPK